MATTPEHLHEMAIQDAFEAFNHHDLDGFLRPFADDATLVVLGAPMVQTKPELRRLLEGYLRAFPDLRMDITDSFCTSAGCVVEWVLRGTNTGEIQPLPGMRVSPTNRTVEERGCDVIGFVGDQIKWVRQYRDHITIMRQLGLGPQMAQLPTGS